MVTRLTGILIAALLAQVAVLDNAPRSLDWLRANCAPMKDPFVTDDPSIVRTCTVNAFERLATIDGRDLYYALYRRLVSINGAQPSPSRLENWDKPPYNNTAIAIVEAPAGASDGQVVLAFTDEGELGEYWIEKPKLLNIKAGAVLLVPASIAGTAGADDDRYFLRQGSVWARIETDWSKAMPKLAPGQWIRSAVTDLQGMRGALAIAERNDPNCCPTGGWIVASLELNRLTLRATSFRRQADEPTWLAEVRR